MHTEAPKSLYGTIHLLNVQHAPWSGQFSWAAKK